MTISAKKDGVVNMGGFVAMRSEELFRSAMMYNIMFEGYVTYGGMSGRDMDALAVGLDENTEFEQLDARIRQVKLLGDLLDEYGVPYQRPAGGHAIFVDAKKVLPNLPKEQFIAQTLAVELYLEAGIRGVEIGSILADRDPETHEPHEYYAKLPDSIAQRDVLVVDPMLATGGSATAAIQYLRKLGVRNIKLVVLVAAPEGIEAVLAADPDVRIYTCAIDEGLNERAYIVPGLGDAGDRIFGTK